MLQSINPNVQAGPSGAAGEALPAGFAQAQGAGEAPQVFDLQLALRGFAAAEPSAPLPEAAPAAPLVSGEADAEQWLASVLGQQAVRVAAREMHEAPERPERVDEADEAGEPLAALPSEVLLPPLPASREQTREAPAPTPAAAQPVAARPTAPLPVQVAAPMLPAAVDAEGQAPLLASAAEAVDTTLFERLPVAAGEGEKSAPGAAQASQSAAPPLNAERSLKLPAAQAQWGEQMLHSLREQVEVQINQRIQNATIRLDPPELGSLEIYLSHESGRLHVQLTAANGEVARLLQQTSERLRQELVGQHFVQVGVQVSADAQGGRQHGQAPRQAWLVDEPVQAASAGAIETAGRRPDSPGDVLVTV